MLDERASDISELERIGLSNAEARIYLVLVRNGAPMNASAVVKLTKVPRSSVYPALMRLSDIGLVDSEPGYGGRFTAVRPSEALASLMARARDDLSERESIAGELSERLESLIAPGENYGEAEIIQVLRDPRVIAERFDRLQLETEQQIEVFTKAPFFMRAGNPTEDKVLRRGVRARSLYEQAVLKTPEIRPYLEKWLSRGEEARIYNGELPHKLALFDRQNILMPLITPTGMGRTLFVKSPQLGESLGLLFDFLWERAKPIAAASGQVVADLPIVAPRKARNGRISRPPHRARPR